jgi:hypothetical protein
VEIEYCTSRVVYAYDMKRDYPGRVNMPRLIIVLAGLTAAIAAMLLLAACGGSDPPVEQRATTLLGGPLSNFGGADGSDPAVRAVARDIATSRTYDFTPAGFVIASGASASEGLLGSGYGDGTGTITVAAGAGTVEQDISATTATTENIAISGSFESALAQLAVNTPGSSFTVSWTFTFEIGGESFTLTADQVLSGSNWVAI